MNSLIENCYKSDNYCAYVVDSIKKTQKVTGRLMSSIKMYNFVPTYDKWCLYCDNKYATKQCSGCKSVFFCNKDCEKKANPVHKRHCGRDLFKLCSACGKDYDDSFLKCDSCPVKFCTEECKSQIYAPHKDFDCDYFSKTFNK